MRSTRDRFQDAISGAPSIAVAAGVVTAMHLATMRELFDELEELLNGEEYALGSNLRRYQEFKDEYTA